MADKCECIAIIKTDARGVGLCIDPIFAPDAVTIRPVPRALHGKMVAGEIWEGRFGVVHHYGKHDKNGKKILVQYFIPLRKTTVQHVLKDTIS